MRQETRIYRLEMKGLAHQSSERPRPKQVGQPEVGCRVKGQFDSGHTRGGTPGGGG